MKKLAIIALLAYQAMAAAETKSQCLVLTTTKENPETFSKIVTQNPDYTISNAPTPMEAANGYVALVGIEKESQRLLVVLANKETKQYVITMQEKLPVILVDSHSQNLLYCMNAEDNGSSPKMQLKELMSKFNRPMLQKVQPGITE